ncbi:MAG: nuclear transport factor 2 family protein [Verrucomicrobiaceae bacterium]|nr:nuclear transport factor 2 family protein [Verrucomicrobiaceae bacterium]
MRGLEAKWQDAVKAKDVDALEQLLAEDFVGISVDGERASKEGMLRALRNDKHQYRSARAQKMKVRRIRPGLMEVTGIATESGTTADGRRFDSARAFVNRWRSRGGNWECVRSEASELPKR